MKLVEDDQTVPFIKLAGKGWVHSFLSDDGKYYFAIVKDNGEGLAEFEGVDINGKEVKGPGCMRLVSREAAFKYLKKTSSFPDVFADDSQLTAIITKASQEATEKRNIAQAVTPLKDDLEREKSRRRADVNRLNDELKEKSAEAEQFKTETQRLTDENASLKNKLDSSEVKSKHLNVSATRLHNECMRLRNERADLKRRHEDMKKNILFSLKKFCQQ